MLNVNEPSHTALGHIFRIFSILWFTIQVDDFEQERMWMELVEAHFIARLPYKMHQHQPLNPDIRSEVNNAHFYCYIEHI